MIHNYSFKTKQQNAMACIMTITSTLDCDHHGKEKDAKEVHNTNHDNQERKMNKLIIKIHNIQQLTTT